MKCADCKFWSAKKGDPWADGVGECRRHAPLPVLLADEGDHSHSAFVAWPLTLDEQFCGEFVAAKSPSFV